jgi:uncharacterized protein (TIGR02679 family)
VTDARLSPAARAVVGDARLLRLLQSAHRRLEANGGDVSRGAVVVPTPTDDERLACDRIMGARSRGNQLRMPLDRLDAVLRERTGASLATLAEAAVGPLRDRPAERAATAAGEAAMWSAALDHPAVARHPMLAGWIEGLRSTGRWRALDDPSTCIRRALDVVERLPATVPIGRSRLSASVLGDSHALDSAEPVGRLVIAALAHLAGLKAGGMSSADRRRLWSSVNVDYDETSSTALTLGLRPLPVGPLTGAARAWAEGGVALPVPLAALRHERWALPSGTRIWICENPSVLHAAASRFGYGCPSMICVEGNPSLAALKLITVLRDSGASLAYHGDFGSGGVGIGNRIIGALGAAPWRFGASDYRDAVAGASAAGVRCVTLKGRVPKACWDDELAPAMTAAGVEIEEELVLDSLLADLAE